MQNASSIVNKSIILYDHKISINCLLINNLSLIKQVEDSFSFFLFFFEIEFAKVFVTDAII